MNASDLAIEYPTVTMSTPGDRSGPDFLASGDPAGLIVVDERRKRLLALPGTQVLRLAVSPQRCVLNRRSLLLAYPRAGYNLAEGVIAMAPGAAATSAALLGFGLDSLSRCPRLWW